LLLSIQVIQSIRNIQHVNPPPPDFYQSRQAYWGNPYSAADSDNDSNDMLAAAPNPTLAVTGLMTEALTIILDDVAASDVLQLNPCSNKAPTTAK
jgi:hypothetical protein